MYLWPSIYVSAYLCIYHLYMYVSIMHVCMYYVSLYLPIYHLFIIHHLSYLLDMSAFSLCECLCTMLIFCPGVCECQRTTFSSWFSLSTCISIISIFPCLCAMYQWPSRPVPYLGFSSCPRSTEYTEKLLLFVAFCCGTWGSEPRLPSLGTVVVWKKCTS